MTRKAIVAFLAVAIGLAITPSATAVGSPPVPTMPGSGRVGALIAEDAIYTLNFDAPGSTERDTVLFTRSLNFGLGTVNLGPSTRVARASGYAMAEHDGTLAYLRRVDGRLVLRAPDGTETVPAWGQTPNLVGYGPESMSSNWLSAGGVIYDLQTGDAHDPVDWSPAPPEGSSSFGYRAQVTDSRATWTLVTWDDATPSYTYEVYTVALDSDGPVGTAVRLESQPDGWADSVGFVGDRIVWQACPSGGCVVRSVPVASPEDLPTEREISDNTNVTNASDYVALITWDTQTTVVYDPADPGVDLYSHDLDEATQSYGDAWRTFLSYYDSEDETDWLVDLAGRTVTADSTVPAPSSSFADVPTGNTFIEDIRWLADLEITTGYADGTFHPTAPVSRQAMAAFLYRFAGSPAFAPPVTSPFVDVLTSHQFYKQISWLADTGISTGTVAPTGTRFNPGSAVSRQAMAAFLHRMHTGGYTGAWDNSAIPFTYGDSPALDALWDACTAEDWAACDQLFTDSSPDTEYWEYGDTCGGRQPLGTGLWCVDSMV